jgi:hypothetical protein
LPEQAEILLVVDAPHDDEDVATLDAEAELRHLELVDQQVDLLPDVVGGVDREPLELGAEVATGVVDGGIDSLDRLARSPRYHRAPDQHLVALDGDGCTLDHGVHDLVARVVDKQDARAAQQQRPHGGIATGDGR